eukprot:12366156-Karenia_brevis.AAC.1
MVISGAPRTSMSKKRLHKATMCVRRISHLPHPRHVKARFIRTCAHSQGLYGCEASHVDEVALASYTSAVAKVVGPSNQMHAKSLVFTLSNLGLDLCPTIAIQARRFGMMRRIICKWPSTKAQISRIFDAYEKMSFTGVHSSSTLVDALRPAPAPESDHRY